MPSPLTTGATANRLVEATLELIEDEGGSTGVNLRQIARRVGCAHTNVYNYFPTFQDLLWAAFRRGLDHYADYLIRALDTDLEPEEYLRRAVSNLAAYPAAHPGRYRFIAADPFDLTTVPTDILDYVTGMKDWLALVFQAAAASSLTIDEATDAADIVLAYIDGETLNLINGRVIPREDVQARIARNAIRIFQLLINDSADRVRQDHASSPDPQLIFCKRREDQA